MMEMMVPQYIYMGLLMLLGCDAYPSKLHDINNMPYSNDIRTPGNQVAASEEFPRVSSLQQPRKHNAKSKEQVGQMYGRVMDFLEGLGLDVNWRPVIGLESHLEPGFWDAIESAPEIKYSKKKTKQVKRTQGLPDIPPKMLKFLIEKMQQEGITEAELPGFGKDLSVGLDLKTISQMMRSGRRHQFVKHIDAGLKSLGK